jgi:hypothetical protein
MFQRRNLPNAAGERSVDAQAAGATSLSKSVAAVRPLEIARARKRTSQQRLLGQKQPLTRGTLGPSFRAQFQPPSRMSDEIVRARGASRFYDGSNSEWETGASQKAAQATKVAISMPYPARVSFQGS